MFFRRALLFLFCMCPLMELEAAPPWKQAYRAQRDVMRAQLEYQQAVSGGSKQFYQQQKQSLRQQEKYMRQEYRSGTPAMQYAYPNRGPAGVVAVPLQTAPRSVYMTPSSGPSRSTAVYRSVPQHAVPIRVVPTNAYSTNGSQAVPAGMRIIPGQPVNRVYSSTSAQTTVTTNGGRSIVRSYASPNGQVVSRDAYDSRGYQVYDQPMVVHSTAPATNYRTVNPSVPHDSTVVESPARSASQVVYSTPQSFQSQPNVSYDVVHEPIHPAVNPTAPATYTESIVQSAPPTVIAQPTHNTDSSVTSTSATQLTEQLPELIPVPLADSQRIEPHALDASAIDNDPQPTPAKRPVDVE